MGEPGGRVWLLWDTGRRGAERALRGRNPKSLGGPGSAQITEPKNQYAGKILTLYQSWKVLQRAVSRVCRKLNP